MNKLDTPSISLGPVAASTLLSRNYRANIEAWCDHLHQHIHTEVTVSGRGATALGAPWLEGCRVTWLANDFNEPWLRIIEVPDAIVREPFKNYGWLSLEICVEDVDELYKELIDSPFKIVGEPANLDVSDDIQAMQVIGLDGEVLYLTQVNAQVPPFEIAPARCAVDKTFIPVAVVPDRDKARKFYDNFDGIKSYEFDTKITVLNDALGFEHAHRHPVSLVQLAGKHMIEFDEVKNLAPAQTFDDAPMTGIIAISFEVPKLPKDCSCYNLKHGPYIGHNACLMSGDGGEIFELIEVGR